ncbi:MAG: ABC transporter ATP-binding protein [Mycoplasma sp.]
MLKNIINCSNISLKNNDSINEEYILRNISFSINEGDFVIILGKSGSGKTTLLNIIAGLIKPDSGSLLIKDRDIVTMSDDEKTYWRRYFLGYVFQNYGLFNVLNVYDNIRSSVDIANMHSNKAKKYFQDYSKFKSTQHNTIDEVMKKLDIVNLKNKFPNELSGGQQQRVSLARVILKQPEIILADEPTGALDTENSEIVMKMIYELNKKGSTVLMITHNENLVQYANKIIHISDGLIKSIEDVTQTFKIDTIEKQVESSINKNVTSVLNTLFVEKKSKEKTPSKGSGE